MGHDWEGEFDFLKDKCEVIYLNRTEGISTTKIKQELYGKTLNNSVFIIKDKAKTRCLRFVLLLL